jgi:glycosyltransferase involved in cell wall biosynthesis
VPERPLRILHVCSASRLIYGAAHSLSTLAAAQRAAGKSVEILSFKGKAFGSEMRSLGFTVHEVPVRAKVDPFAIAAIRRLIERRRYDIVQTHLSTSSVIGSLAARKAGVPCVATVHGMSSKYSFAFADHLIGVSEGVKRHLASQGVPNDRISVVYNGLVLPPKMEQAEARRRLQIPQDAIVVGTVSRVTPLKGVDDAIRAVAILAHQEPRLLYIVVGEGDALHSCMALARDLGIADRIRFEGYRKNVPAYLAAMDCFVFPTHREAMGIALVEAMAAGLPCVASDVDGIPEVLPPGTGLLTPARNPASLAAGVRRVLDSTELAEALGSAARKRAQEVFSADAMERSTDWVYREMLGLGVPIEADQVARAQTPV